MGYVRSENGVDWGLIKTFAVLLGMVLLFLAGLFWLVKAMGLP